MRRGVTDDKLNVLKACHAIDISYVFNNPNKTDDFGVPDKEFLSDVSSAWVNFATTGDPGYGWTEYNAETRATMIFGDDNSMEMIDDPKREARELLMPLYEARFI